MKYIVLVILSIYLHFHIQSAQQFNFNRSSAKKINLSLKSKTITNNHLSLISSTLTGNKKYIKKPIKKNLKRFGLMHLFTPSGLHLSSVLVFSFGNIFLILILLGASLIIVKIYPSLFSLERVIYFKIIYLGTKFLKIQLSPFIIFFLTICLSLLIGNYQKSPYSFLYSFIFWGTIIIHAKNKYLMLVAMNISLHVMGSLSAQETNILSLVLNPILTTSFVLIFPLFILRAITGEIFILDKILDIFIEYWLYPINYFSQFDFLSSFKPSLYFLLFFYLVFKTQYKKSLIIFCLFTMTNTNTPKSSRSSHKNLIVNIPKQRELKIESNQLFFYDIKCRRKNVMIRCKKDRSSRYGGPSI